MLHISKYKKTIIFMSILMLITFLFCFGLMADEPFTMGLIKNNYGDIIKLTSLDVHPPLYYLTLKFFLTITTFWSNNIFIKIFFARLLSVIFSTFSLIYINKLMHILQIKYKKIVNLLFFLIIPLGLGVNPQIIYIRMYSLSLLLGLMTLFYIINYIKTKKSTYLIPITILTTLSIYNNYYTAITIIVYLIAMFFYLIIKKQFNSSLKVFLSSICSLVLYIPWIPHLLSQIQLSSNHSSTIAFKQFINCLPIVIIIIVMGIIINIYNIDKLVKKVININMCAMILTFSINIISNPGVISTRYIIIPVVCNFIICLNYIFYKTYNYKTIVIIATSFILISNFCMSLYKHTLGYSIPAISLMQRLNTVKKNPSKEINTKYYSLNQKEWEPIGNAIYLQSMHKKINDKNYISTYSILGNGNKKLFKVVFPSIEHFTDQKSPN